MEKHVPNLLAALWALGFFGVFVGLSKLVRPDRRPADPAAEATENDSTKTRRSKSSRNPTDEAGIRMAPGYQVLISAASVLVLGLLMFYPAASAFRGWLDDGRGTEALALIGWFLGTLSVALGYAWMKGDLTWNFDKEDHGNPGKRLP